MSNFKLSNDALGVVARFCNGADVANLMAACRNSEERKKVAVQNFKRSVMFESESKRSNDGDYVYWKASVCVCCKFNSAKGRFFHARVWICDDCSKELFHSCEICRREVIGSRMVFPWPWLPLPGVPKPAEYGQGNKVCLDCESTWEAIYDKKNVKPLELPKVAFTIEQLMAEVENKREWVLDQRASKKSGSESQR